MMISKLMKQIFAVFCALFISSSILFAEIGDDYENDEDKNDYLTSTNLNNAGDQYIKLGLTPVFPVNFDGKLEIGGAGELGYHRFINPLFALGVDISFGYNPTIGENIFTYIPMMISATFQPTFKSFEFPITAGVGMAMENYLNKTYFPGLTLKGAGGIFYRMSPSWSFGLEGQFMYMPQFYENSKYNDYGCFASVEVVARYHF